MFLSPTIFLVIMLSIKRNLRERRWDVDRMDIGGNEKKCGGRMRAEIKSDFFTSNDISGEDVDVLITIRTTLFMIKSNSMEKFMNDSPCV